MGLDFSGEWRCQKYGPLAWMEYVIRLLAVGVAIGSLSIYTTSQHITPNLVIGQLSLLCIIGAGYLAYGFIRVLEKEMIALIICVLEFVACWIMVLVGFQSISISSFIFTYVFLMILAEYTRIMYLFLAETVEIKYMTRKIQLIVTSVFLLFWLTILSLQIAVWITSVSYTQ